LGGEGDSAGVEGGVLVTTIAEKDMAVPRLELRWEDKRTDKDGFVYTVECVYSLVLNLGKYDIRAERADEKGRTLPNVTTMTVRIGGTLSTGTASKRYWEKDDRVDEPFRDGAHAQWDAAQLGDLPIYAVAAGRAMLLPKRERKEVE